MEARLAIWERFWSEKIPILEPISLAAIATDHKLSGGQIQNAFRIACLDAAKKGGMDMVILHAACEEVIRDAKALSKEKDSKTMGFRLEAGRTPVV